jgi:hypothetical protein
MQEFTIRNKSTRPIMTLTPKVFAAICAARPESVSLVLAKKVKDYKDLTGKALSLDYEQQRVLLERAGADARGTWASQYSQLPYPLSQVRPVFADGFMLRILSGSLAEDLALAEAFYALLDAPLAAGAGDEVASPAAAVPAPVAPRKPKKEKPLAAKQGASQRQTEATQSRLRGHNTTRA